MITKSPRKILRKLFDDMICFGLKKYLRLYCEYELDQFERWKIYTKYGYVYISLDRDIPDHLKENYDRIR